MKVLVIDTGSNAINFAVRCVEYGHEVRYYDQPRKDGTQRRAGEGLIEKVHDLDKVRKKWLGWADLIYAVDNAHYLDLLKPYRDIGYPIYGGTPDSADLELNRALGQLSMKNHGIKVMESKTFSDYDVAADFVKKNPEYLVSKPSGDADKALSYVAHDAADLTYMLQRWKKNEKYRKDAKKDGFILQEKINGCEMACGGWYGPGGWSEWFNINFEFKKLCDGDLGVATGEMGTLVQMVKRDKLIDKILLPITPKLKELEYVGYVDNNSIIDDRGVPWPLEWTMRDGWPHRHNVDALFKNEDPAQWMLDLCLGVDSIEAKENECCISVLMALPDFPYSNITNKELCGIPIYGANDREQIHYSEVMLGNAPIQAGDKVVEAPMIVSAGDYLLVATGCGETVTGARKSAYSAIKKIHAPNSPFYRLDIGRGRLLDQLPKIQKHGYAKNLAF